LTGSLQAKVFTVCTACWIALSAAACGGSGGEGSGQASGEGPVTFSATSVKRPAVEIPSGPPPEKLEIKDLEVGTGPAIEFGTSIATNYIAISYETGKAIQEHWGPHEVFRVEFIPGGEVEAWEKGLVGMKAGGVRELRAPARMAYGEGAVLYMIHLLSVQ
jgi:FKBP-type peptidyl-prolyl cis-trans isomerase